MRFGSLVIAENGVAFGIADKDGNGIGFLYDHVKASGIKFERSSIRCRSQPIKNKYIVIRR